VSYRKVGLLASAGIASLVALAGCGSSSNALPTNLSATQVLDKALAAARQGGSVHIQESEKQGAETRTDTIDSLASSGSGVLTEGSSRIELRLVGSTGYLRGNQAGLAAHGFPAAAAGKLANKWISVPSSSTPYADFTSAVTFSQVLGKLKLGAPLTKLAVTTVDGQRVLGIRGIAPAALGLPAGAAVTMYVADTGPTLPVSLAYQSGKTQDVVAFSNWGEKLTIAAPAGAIPLSSLSG
jgi:hypothetical protein